MKKRILGLALALVMIISLLPLTTFAAASPSVKVRFVDPVSNTLDAGLTAGQSEYIVFEDVLDTDGTTVLGNKPVKASAAPATGGYIKVSYTSEGVLTIALNNINYKRSASSTSPFIQAYKNTTTGATSEFDIVIELVGTNKIEGTNASISTDNTGEVTIQGEGSLEMIVPQTYKKGTIWAIHNSKLTIKDTTVKATIEGGSSTRYGIVSEGEIVIDGATVEIDGDCGYNLATRSGSTANITNCTTNDSNVTIKNNATLKAKVTAGNNPAIVTNGTVTFENSNVYLSHSNTRGSDTENAYSVLSKAPTIIGTYSTKQAAVNGYAATSMTYKDYDSFGLTAGDQLRRGTTAGTCIRTINLVHKHEAVAGEGGDCTKGIVCVCGYTITAGAPAHVAGAGADDCTKDTMCGNAGCTKVFEAAKGTAHVAGEDDGDCTTDIKCKNCEQVAVKGAEKHTYTRTDCSKEAVCTVCNKVVAKAGEHSGGTATCKDKAKCEVCNAEYGELAACKPAADDGDCTTAIKCSVCGKQTTAGQAAHKYTDKADTTCDNAGCTNTRKVEGDTTENPKTGDTALVLIACLMMASAAAFVCTKKFAR